MLGGTSASPRLDGSTGSPLPAPRTGVPSPPTSLTGLPDEAFESLTQLQHIYVAHNKVSPLLTPTPRIPRPGLARQGCSPGGVQMGQRGAGRGPPGPLQLCSRSSLWLPSFCPAPSVLLIWLPTK